MSEQATTSPDPQPPSNYLKVVSSGLVQLEEMLNKSLEVEKTIQEQLTKANTSKIGLLAQKALLVELKKKFELMENPPTIKVNAPKISIPSIETTQPTIAKAEVNQPAN